MPVRGASIEWIAKWVLKTDVAKAQVLVDEMMKRGWLERTKAGDYDCTYAGRSLALASLLKPISRATADEIVADLVDRARAINANPDLLAWVKQLRVFGSYITTSDDLGDIDVAYELERRIDDGKQWVAASERHAKAAGKQIKFPHTLNYGDREVELLLKNRERRLSFHAVSELEELKAESRVIYAREAPPVILARPSKPLEQRQGQIERLQPSLIAATSQEVV
jgi:hypothetical protein